MTEQAQNTEIKTGSVPTTLSEVAPATPVTPTPVATPEQVQTIQTAQNTLPPVQESIPAPAPVKLDRLGHNEKFVFTDANGYEWPYEFQFPGLRRAYEIFDNARMANGQISKAALYDEFCEAVIVSPANLTVDSFDERPGFEEVMDAVDTFCGKWIS